MPRIALLSIAAVLLAAAPAGAATVNVQNQNDSGPGSLRKAIADANPNDDVLLPPGTYNLTSGELDVGKNLQLIGAGAGAAGGTAITAGGKSRVFNIHDGTVTLKDMRITGGKATQGAGIQVTSTLNLERVVVAGNVAGGGNVHGEGGGIFANGQALHLLNSTVTGNRAGGGGAAGSGLGGGIKVGLGNTANRVVTLDRSAVTGNTAGGNGSSGFGGGIDASAEGTNTKLDMTITDSTVAGNVAAAGVESYGGGIEAGSGNNNSELKIALNRSTISGNRTAAAGGAAGLDYQSGTDNNIDQTLTVTDSTIARNTAPAGGTGALAFVNNGGGSSTSSETITNATVAGNTGRGFQGAAAATVRNSIVADNSGVNCDAPFASTSHDIEDTNTCGLDTGVGDQPSTDPKLGPLGDYGGPTRTMLPHADSPALNKAESLYCSMTDQRGVHRPQGPDCDVGSDEVQLADVALTASRNPKTVSAGKVVTYRFTARNKGPQVAQGVTLIDKLPAKLKLVSVAGCTGKLAAGCRIGTVPFGATRTVTIKARARRSGKVTNLGRATSFAADPVLGNNTAATALTILPSLTKLSMKPKTWPLGSKTTIRFTLSDPGQVTLAFARKGKDGKFHKAGSRKVGGKRGKNKLSFDGDLGGGKVLKTGRYRLTARVRDAGGRTSRPARLQFKLTP